MLQKETTQNNSSRVTAFDGLRGFAIIAIILYHLIPYRVPGGFLGVDTFLVLSGYLITDSLARSLMEKGKISLGTFLKKRLARTVRPMWWMCLIVTSYITIFQRDLLVNLRSIVLASLTFVNNWWQIIFGLSYFDKYFGQSPFTHLWYLAVAFQLYLLWPIVFVAFSAFMKRYKTFLQVVTGLALLSFIAMALLYQPGSDPSRVYYGTDTRAFAFLIGAITALVWPLKQFSSPLTKQQKTVFRFVGILSVVGMLLLMQLLNDNSDWTYRGGMFAYAVTTAVCIITALHPNSLVSTVFRLKPLTWVGRRSYSYYIWYFPVIVLYQVIFKDTSGNSWLHIVVQIVLIMILGECSYQLLERKPVGTIKQRLLERKTVVTNVLSNPKGHRNHFIRFVVFVFLLISSATGLALSTDAKKQDVQDLQQVITQNEQKATETQTANKESITTINNVEGITREETVYSNSTELTFIGDSILLAITNQLEPLYPKAIINGAVGRQLYQSSSVVGEMQTKGLVKNPVVVMLGSNGGFSFAQLESLIKTIGIDKQIFFVNTNVPRTWQTEVNQLLNQGAEKYSNVHLIDWKTHAENHSEWFYEDGVHPNEEGSKEMSIFIAKEVYKEMRGH